MTPRRGDASPVTRGAYRAERAAALSGVPLRTVYYWARHEVFSPSVSKSKIMLWSWADLIALRAIYWLRSKKPESASRPATMNKVRDFLSAVEFAFGERLGEALAERAFVLRLDKNGEIYFSIENNFVKMMQKGAAQVASPELLVDLLSDFNIHAGVRGPHLVVPRPNLRIMPGKLGGEPHVEGTRLETRSIVALLNRGAGAEDVLALYPFLKRIDISEASDLEQQLINNLTSIAA